MKIYAELFLAQKMLEDGARLLLTGGTPHEVYYYNIFTGEEGQVKNSVFGAIKKKGIIKETLEVVNYRGRVSRVYALVPTLKDVDSIAEKWYLKSDKV